MIMHRRFCFNSSILAPTLTFLFLFGLMSNEACARQLPSFSFKHYTAYSPSQSSFISQISRLNLTYTYASEYLDLTISPDLDIDYTNGTQASFTPTEYYADLYFTHADVKLGRQSFSWGASPLQSVNNFLTPVTLTEFLLPDAEDLPDARLAASVILYRGASYLQLIYAPRSRATELPDIQSVWFPTQNVPDFVELNFEPETIPALFSSHQVALRYAYRETPGLELDLMAYYWSQPNAVPGIYITPGDIITPPVLTLRQQSASSFMGGTTLSWQTHRWIFRNEWLWIPDQRVHQFNVPVSTLRDFTVNPQSNLALLNEFELRDDGYLVRKSSISSVIGAEHARWGSTIGLEFRLRYLHGITETILAEAFTAAISGYFERSFVNDRLQLLVLSTYQTAGKDLWNRLEVDYSASDIIQFGAGANFFSGPEPKPLFSEVTFQTFRKNSSIYLKFTLNL